MTISDQRLGGEVHRVTARHDEDWPMTCKGTCGRLVRPPHKKIADYDVVTVSATSNEGYCVKCMAARNGRVYKSGGTTQKRYTRTPAEEEAMITRLRAEYEAMCRSRRARGIPPEGLVLPGDEPMKLGSQTKVPNTDLPVKHGPQWRRPKAKPQYVTADDASPLGYCGKGHKFDYLNAAGHRRCRTCQKENNLRFRRERTGRPVVHRRPADENAPYGYCERGHAFDSVHTTKAGKVTKYCGKCKKARHLRNRRDPKAGLQHAA